MSSDVESDYADALKSKRICRFCLVQEEPLTNIYSIENRKNSRAPLPLQIMSCVSIEVFSNDEMPNTICDRCRRIMDYCYRFKQMCKKADTSLKQYPLTGLWPDAIEHPTFPEEVKTVEVKASPQKTSSLKRRSNHSISPAKKKSLLAVKAEIAEDPLNIEDMIIEISDAPATIVEEVKNPPKILNLNNAKILNKNAPGKTIEPIITRPSLHTTEDGHIEIVSEIISSVADESNSMLNAEPVETQVYTCKHCDRSFPLRQLMEIHAANHVRDRKFTCEHCQKAFFSKYDLAKHSFIHTGERPYKCVVCGKAFARSTLLRRHEKTHSDQPKFLCAYCERPFLSKDEWEKHTLNHQKNRPYACSACPKTFAFKQGLERHQVVHQTDQPFKCEHCTMGFSTLSKLARHLTAHAGVRPYPCGICNRSYLLSHHRTRHMRSHKDAVSTYKCHECNETFNKRDDLIYHSAEHATSNCTCPLCKETFKTVEDVTEHIRLHAEAEEFACVFCDSIFVTDDKLQEHCNAEHSNEIEIYEKDDRERQIQMKKEANNSDQENESFGDESFELTPLEVDEINSADEIEETYEEIAVTKAVEKAALATKRPTEAKKTIQSNSTQKTVLPTKRLTNQMTITGSSAAVKLETSKSLPTDAKLTKLPKLPVVAESSSRPIRTFERSSKNSNQKATTEIQSKKNVVSPTSASVKKSPNTQSLTTKIIENKLKNVTVKKVSATTPNAATEKPTSSMNMKIGEKTVKVQQVRMTKAAIELMKKQGKIQMQNGHMILKRQRQ